MESNINVIKRDGTKQQWDVLKIRKTINWATEGIEGVDPMEIEDHLVLVVTDNIKTIDLIETMIDTIKSLVSKEKPNYIYVAGRLLNMHLNKNIKHNRKKLGYIRHMNKFGYTDLYSYLEWACNELSGVYDHNLTELYGKGEIKYLNDAIDLERDNHYAYSTIALFGSSVLAKYKGLTIEMPQEALMITAMTLFKDYPEEHRLDYVIKEYKLLKDQKLSPASPIINNHRKPHSTSTSCEIITYEDNLHSISNSHKIVMEDSALGTGLGAYIGHLRAGGSWRGGKPGIANSSMVHVNAIDSLINSVSQADVRDANITVTQDIWHLDINDFIKSKDENGDQRFKTHSIFRAVSVPDIFMRRVESNDVWTLFDPYEIKKFLGKPLEDTYGEEFETNYIKLEQAADEGKIKLFEKTKARQLFIEIIKRVPEAGDPMFHFRDISNRGNPNSHKGVIYSSNLCAEVLQSQRGVNYEEEDGYVTEVNGNIYTEKTNIEDAYAPVCNLTSLNLGQLDDEKDIENLVEMAVRTINSVIDSTELTNSLAMNSNKLFRPSGIGIIGYAHALAKRGLQYGSEEALLWTSKIMEKIGYYAVKYSSIVAKEMYRPYEMFEGSQWQKGVFFGKSVYTMGEKWVDLYENYVKKYGMANGYLMAIAPNTTTSLFLHETPSIFPLKAKILMQDSKVGKFLDAAPDLDKYFWNYSTLDRVPYDKYLATAATFYKYVDQAISMEVPIDLNVITPKDLYNFYITAWKMKIKTVYYGRPESINCTDCAN
jgi:ribonucleoside-diphosphate reductase alpha chain